ncbi:uncharacterized protein BBA_03188 [Beauveria bassiana ARSEF 2860]|uniref:Uncharacterized protein n=1 Tax=Beauveria bassiana (strain ARSEF 2860) TaxID=655819 RepID=J4URW2_BEAB2|nr:uncharacterized protein BBA_03188 [Beauveria bassiana ARSEF 2860]EJP68292.1 hypothetical protein BBA_03188 [Beauveria bassiana ARSEF 2860]
MDLQPWELYSSDSESLFISDSKACPDDNDRVPWQGSPKFCSLFFADDKDAEEESDPEPFYRLSDEVPLGPAAAPPIRPRSYFDFDITDEDSDAESIDAIEEEHLAAAPSADVHEAESEGWPGAAQGANVAPSAAWCQELKMMRKELEANTTIIMDRLDHLCTANAIAPKQVTAVATIPATGKDTGTQTYRQERLVACVWAEEVLVRGQQVVVEDGGAWKYVTVVLFLIAALWTAFQVTLDG